MQMRREGHRELTGRWRENDKQIFIHPAEEIRGKKPRRRDLGLGIMPGLCECVRVCVSLSLALSIFSA